jgi:sugar lactone lactonase YvrE
MLHLASDASILDTWDVADFPSVSSLAFTPDGDLLVVSPFYPGTPDPTTIAQFRPDGTLLRMWSTQTEEGAPVHAQSMAVAPDSTIVVLDWERKVLERYTRDGELLEIIGNGKGTDLGSFWSPASVAVDAAGTIYVSDPQLRNVQRYVPSGS